MGAGGIDGYTHCPRYVGTGPDGVGRRVRIDEEGDL